jgi:hypothetical protein
MSTLVEQQKADFDTELRTSMTRLGGRIDVLERSRPPIG